MLVGITRGSFVAALLLLGTISCQTITVTETLKNPTCSIKSLDQSSFLEGSLSSRLSPRSTVTIISTQTVYASPAASISALPEPAPLNDTLIASGIPFSLEIATPFIVRNRRQVTQRTWITNKGLLTTEATKSATFQLLEGRLLCDGLFMSTNVDVNSQVFAPIIPVGSIQLDFFTAVTVLNWTNTAFDNTTARFFIGSSGGEQAIVVLFKGKPTGNLTAVNLAARPAKTPLLPSSSSIEPPATPSDRSVSHTSNPTYSTWSSSELPVASSASPPVNSDAACGPANDGTSCSVSFPGACCSKYGFCGFSPDHCGEGCQVGFGYCPNANLPNSTKANTETQILASSVVFGTSSSMNQSSSSLRWTSSVAMATSTWSLSIVSSSSAASWASSLAASSTVVLSSSYTWESSIATSPSSGIPPWTSSIGRSSNAAVSSSSDSSFVAVVASSTKQPVFSFAPTTSVPGWSSINLLDSSSVGIIYSFWRSSSITWPSPVMSSSPAVASSAPSQGSAAASAVSFGVSSLTVRMFSSTSSLTSIAAPSPSSTQPAIQCPAANGTIYTTANSWQFVILCGYDSGGNAVLGASTGQATSMEACINYCAQYPACVAASWTNKTTPNTGACYLKSTFGSLPQSTTQWSARFIGMANGADKSAGVGPGSSAVIPISSSTVMMGGSSVLVAGSSRSSGSVSSSTMSIVGSSSVVMSSFSVNIIGSSTSLVIPSSSGTSSNSPTISTQTNSRLFTTSTAISSVSPMISASPSLSSSPTPLSSSSSTPPLCSGMTPTRRVMNPTPILVSSDSKQDDKFGAFTLPFDMKIYNSVGSRDVFASTNGFLSLDVASSQFFVEGFPTDGLPSYTICPYWDDLAIPEFTDSIPEGIFYNITGGTDLTVEWILSRSSAYCEFYQFQLLYSTLSPNIVKFKYYVIGDGGKNAGIGIQGTGTSSSNFVQFSLMKTDAVQVGLMVTCDTSRVQPCSKSTFNAATG